MSGSSNEVMLEVVRRAGGPKSLEDKNSLAMQMAARLGAAGGASRSKPKAAAARANGALGGRPRKSAVNH